MEGVHWIFELRMVRGDRAQFIPNRPRPLNHNHIAGSSNLSEEIHEAAIDLREQGGAVERHGLAVLSRSLAIAVDQKAIHHVPKPTSKCVMSLSVANVASP